MEPVCGKLIFKKQGDLGLPVCEAEVAFTLWKAFKGLMLRKNLGDGEGLLIKMPKKNPPHSIHSFFMRFTINLVFMDKHGVVVDVALLKPWWQYTSKSKAKWVLELPSGAVNRKMIRRGDVLYW